MKVEYFQRKIGIVQREIWSYLRTVSSRVIEKFLSVKRLDGFVLCIQGQRKTSSSKFQAAWKRLRIVNKGRTFSYKYILDFVRLRFRLSRVSPRRTAFTPTSRCKCFGRKYSRMRGTYALPMAQSSLQREAHQQSVSLN